MGVHSLHKRNPWVAVWWSVLVPGFGHLFLGQTVKGIFLMSWEILMNTEAHLNLAIFHTLNGHWDLAREALDYRFAILYPLVYLYGMCDAYRLAVEGRKLYQLERLQVRRRFDRASVTAWGVHGINRRNPLMSSFWSAMLLGLGQLCNNQFLKALVLMLWYLVVIVKSNLSLAAYHSLLGQFDQARQVLDYQWALFWPSIFVFGVADAYDGAVEQNNQAEEAFRYRMRKYLQNGDAQRWARLLP